MNKKVLILTYYWPPAGGPGVQRVLKFVKFLPEYGWEPIILTARDGEYPAIDSSLVKEIPAGTRVYHFNSIEPYKLFKWISGKKEPLPTHILNKGDNESISLKIGRWIRANLFVPDARIGCIPGIVKMGKKVIQIENPQVIFSSSPPHSIQVGAMKLARYSKLKWIADLRDPWTSSFWNKGLKRSKWAVKKDTRLEYQVYECADAILTVSQPILAEIESNVGDKGHVITNGFDNDDFNISRELSDENFRIVYAGSLRQQQVPSNFFVALERLKKHGQYSKLRVDFYGSAHPSALEIVDQLQLGDIVKFHGYVDHDLLVQKLVNAGLLMLSIPNTPNNEGIVTGKLFEYMGSRNFILAFGPKEGEAAKILRESGSGIMLSFEEDPYTQIENLYTLWEEGSLSTSDSNIQQYSRRSLTEKLAEILNEINES